MSSQQALIAFLTYSYFKIVPKDIYSNDGEGDYSSYCIKKAIMKAYEDATNEGAYNTLFQKTIEAEKLKQLKSASERAKNDSAEFLFLQIQKLNSLASNYEEWHKSTCEGLCKKHSKVCLNEKDPFFRYGNAQKWVNMTMKYLWMLGLLDDAVDYKKLHIPIDSFIIDALWNDDKIEFPLKSENVNRSKKYAKPSDYVIGWSRWYKSDYLCKFRKSISSDGFSLEWENDAWIRQAEKRKKADLKKQYESFFGEIDT